MMLHRHFENEKRNENITTTNDVSPTEKKEHISEVFPPDEAVAPKRRGRPKKTD